MNPLLALMHDTAHPINNTQALCNLIASDTLTEEQMQYLQAIISEMDTLKKQLDSYYLATKDK